MVGCCGSGDEEGWMSAGIEEEGRCSRRSGGGATNPPSVRRAVKPRAGGLPLASCACGERPHVRGERSGEGTPGG
jgi:hypothetical protein